MGLSALQALRILLVRILRCCRALSARESGRVSVLGFRVQGSGFIVSGFGSIRV